MEKDELLLDPKWISSFYALVATAICTLIFTYKGVDFFEAFIKTFFTVVSFYLLGIATAAVINFVHISFMKDNSENDVDDTGEQQEENQIEEDQPQSNSEELVQEQ